MTVAGAVFVLVFLGTAVARARQVYGSVKQLASPLDRRAWQLVADEYGLEWQASLEGPPTLIGLVDGVAVTATARIKDDLPETVVSATIATDAMSGVTVRPRSGLRRLLTARGEPPASAALAEHFDIRKNFEDPVPALSAPEVERALLSARRADAEFAIAHDEVMLTRKGYISDPNELSQAIGHVVRAAAAIDAAE